jgi:hypothetical protein
MDTRKLLRLVSVVLAVVVLGMLAAPVYAGGYEVTAKGTIEKISYMIPEMLRAKGIHTIVWIDGVKVFIDGDTVKEGMLKVGADAEAKGTLKAILATTITVKDDVMTRLDIDGDEVKLTGTVDEVIYHYGMIVAIKVYGIKVLICPETTTVDGMLTVGAKVDIEGTVKALLADELKVERLELEVEEIEEPELEEVEL